MNNIEKKVLRMIGENVDSPDVFTDDDTGMAQIRDSINDAIEEIVFVTGSNKRSFKIPLVADQMFYKINLSSGGFGWVTDAYLVGQKRRLHQTDAIKLNQQDPRWMSTQSTPDAYLQISPNVLGFYPRPASTTDVVDVTCIVIPNDYTSDTDRVRLTTAFERAAVHFAISEYWASRGDAKEAIRHHDQYLDVLGLRQNRPDTSDSQRFFRTSNGPTRSA